MTSIYFMKFIFNLIVNFNCRYGLILPDKAKASQPTFQASRNVFGDDSDSDDNSSKKPVLLRPSDNSNRQVKVIPSLLGL